MQKKICFYITGFGFGHLTRSLAIMERLLTDCPDVYIMIKADTRLLEKAGQYLNKFSGRFSLYPFHSHFSIFVDPITFSVDIQAIRKDIVRWISELRFSAEREAKFLGNSSVEMVLSDIVPEAFDAARRLQIPSLGISNFSWYEVCADVMGEVPELQNLRAMYEAADVILVYPYTTGDLIPVSNKIEVGLIARPFDSKRIGQIRAEYKMNDRPLAFLSVGGSTKVEDFLVRDDMDYLVTMGINLAEADNVYRLPPDMTDSHNYLAACDVVITKCGWSTVTEATLAEKPMWLMLSQNGWLEERCVYQEISGLGIGIAKSITGMNDMSQGEIRSELALMKDAYRTLPRRYKDGMERIIEIVKSYLK